MVGKKSGKALLRDEGMLTKYHCAWMATSARWKSDAFHWEQCANGLVLPRS